jgi:hypothetical protein
METFATAPSETRGNSQRFVQSDSQVIVALALMCRSSYLGIIEFMGVIQKAMVLGYT